MATITTINGTDNITDSRAVINTNFTNLNTDKIEASAIANFETTTQLNARDTVNRNRANHTGTQTASTISDFDTEVSNNTDVSANTSARHTHSNKTILDNTTASFTTADETKLDGIEANANNYSLPTASTTTLGGVKVDGTTITITGGVISSTGGGGGSGDVTGPASSTDNGVVLFNGTTGKIIKDSAKTIVTTLGGDNTTIPTSKAVADAIGSAGGGDMLKSVYDTNDDGIVNQADVITNQGDLATLDSVDTAQITNSAVENTKLAQMNANTVKGRLSGNGTPQDIAMADLPISTATQTALNGKQNILSEGAFVNGDKTKLDGIEAGAEVNTVDSVNGRTGAITGLAEDNEVVKLTGNETIAGVKTFSSSPIVPTPTTDMQVATKKYVDDNAGGSSIQEWEYLGDINLVNASAGNNFFPVTGGNYIFKIDYFTYAGNTAQFGLLINSITTGYGFMFKNATTETTGEDRIPLGNANYNSIGCVYIQGKTGGDGKIWASVLSAGLNSSEYGYISTSGNLNNIGVKLAAGTVGVYGKIKIYRKAL